jgi:hypothetical protein
MLRADHWEVTAVGELRDRTESLALHLLHPDEGPAVIQDISCDQKS